MADAESAKVETITTNFISWHNSGNDLHLLTDSRVLYISKKEPELIERAKKFHRGQPIKATGSLTYSKTLSTYVLELQSLEPA